MCFRARFVAHLLFCANVLHTSSCTADVDKLHPERGLRSGRRQDGYFAPATDPNVKHAGAVEGTIDFAAMLNQKEGAGDAGGAGGEAQRFSVLTSTITLRRRSTPVRVSLDNDCDYLAYYCLKAYKTGKICGRTIYYNYKNFKNYCLLDYVNCMEKYEVWQIVHMGECFQVKPIKDYQHYEYHDDSFLDQTYVIQE